MDISGSLSLAFPILTFPDSPRATVRVPKGALTRHTGSGLCHQPRTSCSKSAISLSGPWCITPPEYPLLHTHTLSQITLGIPLGIFCTPLPPLLLLELALLLHVANQAPGNQDYIFYSIFSKLVWFMGLHRQQQSLNLSWTSYAMVHSHWLP